MHRECDRVELQQQVLASAVDTTQRLAIGLIRRRHSGLQCSETKWHEPHE
jgi:hypothetical protein